MRLRQILSGNNSRCIFCLADKAERKKSWSLPPQFFSSARSIIAGFAVAWLVQSIKFLRSAVSLPVLLSGHHLYSQRLCRCVLIRLPSQRFVGGQVMLKGRTKHGGSQISGQGPRFVREWVWRGRWFCSKI